MIIWSDPGAIPATIDASWTRTASWATAPVRNMVIRSLGPEAV
ncbi:hypothetical protein [Streptomyces sp. NPDC001843]